MKKIIELFRNDKFIYISIFVIMLILFYFMPYQGDDWEWGGAFGLERLGEFFKDFNGRYLGNLFIVTMSRSMIFRSFVTTSYLFLVVYLIKKVFNFKRPVELYLVIILLLAMDSTIMSQAIAWSSGFANYVPPVAIFLLVIYINKEMFSNDNYAISNKKCILMLLLGIIGALFVEHMSIYNLCLSIFLIVYNKLKQKKYILANIYYFIGALAGTILMFSNGGYYRVLQHQDEYREVVKSADFFSRIFYGYFGKIYRPYILNAVVLNVILGVIVLIIGVNFLQKNKVKANVKLTVKTLMFIIGSFNFYNIFRVAFLESYLSSISFIRIVEGVISLIYIVSIILTLFLTIKEDALKRKIFFLIFSTFVMVGPLFFVSPVGSRCFFPVYVFLVGAVVLLFKYIQDNKLIKIDKPYFIRSIMILLFLIIFLIYSSIISVDLQRKSYIKNNQNEGKLYLPKLPFSNYHWNGNPYDEGFVEKYKDFYGIREEVEVIFLNYEKWARDFKR